MTILIILVLLLLLDYSISLSLDVYPNNVRCVGQELDQEDAAVFSGIITINNNNLIIIYEI